MNGLGLLYLISIALLITLFFSYVLRARGPWGSFWTFFVIIFLGVLMADLWVEPIGPFYRDVYWIPPIAVGILIALILAAATPSPTTRSRLEKERDEIAEEQATSIALGTFFWFVLIFMLVLIIAGILNSFS